MTVAKANLETRTKWVPNNLFEGKAWLPFSGFVYMFYKNCRDEWKEPGVRIEDPLLEHWKSTSRTSLRIIENVVLAGYNITILNAGYVLGNYLSQ